VLNVLTVESEWVRSYLIGDPRFTLGCYPAHVCNLFTVLGTAPFFNPFTMSYAIIFNFRSYSFCAMFCFNDFRSFPQKCSEFISGDEFIPERKQIVIHFNSYVTRDFHFYPLKV
jgi:hypothetical protein